MASYLAMPLTEHGKEFYLSTFRPFGDVDLSFEPIVIIGAGNEDSQVSISNISGNIMFKHTVPSDTIIHLNLTFKEFNEYRVSASEPISVYSSVLNL